jgi:hypothetical protein
MKAIHRTVYLADHGADLRGSLRLIVKACGSRINREVRRVRATCGRCSMLDMRKSVRMALYLNPPPKEPHGARIRPFRSLA